MQKRIVLTLLMLFLSTAAGAWQFYQGSDISFLQPGFVLLEPDNWGRADLLEMKKRQVVPLAWLNLAYVEDYRTVGLDIKEKDYVIQGKYRTGGKKIAVFYSEPFKMLVRSRLQEYLLKGFSGVVLANAGEYQLISNSMVNRIEMLRLVALLAQDARKNCSGAYVFLHNSEKIWSEAAGMNNISGVVEEGLYFGLNGREVKEWNRRERLAGLSALQKKGKIVLIAEDSRTDKRKEFVNKQAADNGFDAASAKLPLSIERIEKNGETL